MLRKIASAAVVGAALLAAFGCGGGGNDTSVSAGTGRDGNVAQAAADIADTVPANTVPANTAPGNTAPGNAQSGLRTVTFRGVQFDVPGDWPVYDLAENPSTCVRFDVSAVYLGHPGDDMDCPAGLVGRADAVLVEPSEGRRHRGSHVPDSTGDVAASSASGLGLEVAADAAAASEVAADVPSADVSVTLTYRDSNSTAQQILESLRAAS